MVVVSSLSMHLMKRIQNVGSEEEYYSKFILGERFFFSSLPF